MKYLLIITAIMLSACNTFHGLGQDVSTLGNNISNKAEEKK